MIIPLTINNSLQNTCKSKDGNIHKSEAPKNQTKYILGPWKNCHKYKILNSLNSVSNSPCNLHSKNRKIKLFFVKLA